MKKFIFSIIAMLCVSFGFNVSASPKVIPGKVDSKTPIVSDYTPIGTSADNFTPIVFLLPDLIVVPTQGISYPISVASVKSVAKKGKIQFFPKARSSYSSTNLS